MKKEMEKPSSKTISSSAVRPLAERMRPRKLEEVRGQSHLLGKDCLLPKLIRENRVGNLILAGPPALVKLAWQL